MLKQVLTGAVMAIAASVSLGAAAHAGTYTVGFEDKAAFNCIPGDTQHDGGLSFTNSFYACYYSNKSPADYPFVPASTVMGIGYSDITMSEDDGSVFDLLSLDLSAAPYTLDGDTTLITGFLHGGGTLNTAVPLSRSAFHHIDLNWLGLDSVSFSAPQQGNGYVGFDNIVFTGTGHDTNQGGVPEPAVWLMMLTGFMGSGLMLRRARQLAATYTA